MKLNLSKRFFLVLYLVLLSTLYSAKGQSTVIRQAFDYYELKGLLMKHEATVESLLSMKRFTLNSRQQRPKSTIYVYKKDNDSTEIYIRIRKADGLANEVAWNEVSSTLGNLTHDAVYDGFVPVAGNSQYHNRFQHMALFVGYRYAGPKTVPCIIRSVE